MVTVYGYVRVSSQDQNEVRQLIALRGENILKRNLYIDKKSGKDFERPAYKRLMKRLKQGDLLIIKSIDRLGRNYDEVLEQWRIITKEKGADIRVLDMPLLDTTHARDILGTFIADLVLQILSYCAHAERESIKQRQMEGIAAARDRGVRFGRPRKEFPPQFEELFQAWRRKEITADELSQRCGLSVGTLYRKLREENQPEYEVRHYHKRPQKG